jgi:hypothetical protein
MSYRTKFQLGDFRENHQINNQTTMNSLTKLLCVLPLFATQLSSAQLLSGPIYNPATGHNYYLGISMNWASATTLASTLGGYLVTVNDTSENTWIANTFGSWGDSPRQLWLGLTDQQQEGTHVWLNGDPSTYRNWAPGEPNNGGGFFPDEDAVTMWNPASGFPYSSWTDSPVDQSHFPVIEVPEPTTFALILVAAGLHQMRRSRKQ